MLAQQNLLARVSLEIIRACLAVRIPVALENPRGSRFWMVPEYISLVAQHGDRCCSFVTDYCQWGTQWRKATRLTCWGWPAAVEALGKRCHPCRQRGRGPSLCSRSQMPHQCISGLNPETKQWRTHTAEPYPLPLVEALAKILSTRPES